MNRVVTAVVVLVVLAGSVPVAGALASTAQTDGDGPAPGAAFAGVVGVQQAEIDNEVADRSLEQRFAAAEGNVSKARIVADQQQQLGQRLDGLEAQKERLERAHENGSMSRGEYRARLAQLSAELRALERRANRTAETAASLPEEAMRNGNANVSEVREVAQRANRTGGGEVAEAARDIAGESVGNGLRGPPEGGERGPPEGAGPPENGDETEAAENETEGAEAGEGNGRGNGPPDRTPGPPESNESDGNETDAGENGPPEAPGNGTDGNETDGNESAGNGNNGANDGNGADDRTDRGNSTATDRGNGNDGTNGENGGEPNDGNGANDGNGQNGAGNGDDSENDDPTETEVDGTEPDGTETEV